MIFKSLIKFYFLNLSLQLFFNNLKRNFDNFSHEDRVEYLKKKYGIDGLEDMDNLITLFEKEFGESFLK